MYPQDIAKANNSLTPPGLKAVPSIRTYQVKKRTNVNIEIPSFILQPLDFSDEELSPKPTPKKKNPKTPPRKESSKNRTVETDDGMISTPRKKPSSNKKRSSPPKRKSINDDEEEIETQLFMPLNKLIATPKKKKKVEEEEDDFERKAKEYFETNEQFKEVDKTKLKHERIFSAY